jgi:tripartite-type tricarboxylate transporter receptor subunit TctC
MPPAITDLIAGQVQILLTTFPAIGGHVKSGRVRALAVTSPKRSQFAPELPTVIEAGVPGYEVEIWWGLFGPAGVPRPIVDRVNREMRTMLQSADIREKLAREGAEATLTTPDEFDATLRSSIATWRRVIKEGNIKLE